ncbi:MAG TPA: hypothetical protein VNH11_15815 [Pirellulales bacterium]|nr:hypothetical protein [Pirellulales bacterium]
MVMTLAAVAAASFSVAPGVGIAFVIIATPAFVRTIVITSRQKALGITTTPGQKVLTFCGSVGLVTLLLLSIPVALSMARDMFGKHASAASRGPSELTCLGALGWVMWMVWRRGKNK